METEDIGGGNVQGWSAKTQSWITVCDKKPNCIMNDFVSMMFNESN